MLTNRPYTEVMFNGNEEHIITHYSEELNRLMKIPT